MGDAARQTPRDDERRPEGGERRQAHPTPNGNTQPVARLLDGGHGNCEPDHAQLLLRRRRGVISRLAPGAVEEREIHAGAQAHAVPIAVAQGGANLFALAMVFQLRGGSVRVTEHRAVFGNHRDPCTDSRTHRGTVMIHCLTTEIPRQQLAGEPRLAEQAVS